MGKSKAEARPEIAASYLFWLIMFIASATLFFVVPEVKTLKKSGFTPSSQFESISLTRIDISDLAQELWVKRAEFLNPLKNSLVRFFIAATFVGFALEKAKKYQRELS